MTAKLLQRQQQQQQFFQPWFWQDIGYNKANDNIKQNKITIHDNFIAIDGWLLLTSSTVSYFSPSEVCVVIVLGVVKMSCTKYMHAINEISLLFPLALRK